ncbi:MAG: 16S rRNA (cytosine(1402)-N(4))-methyltransferase RsmH [Polyangia bacterium]|jgi:16S rRNA (cytosine1402-N4)-methyltransferase|nr:16S rRNA (cytosine(1402)-N(4))-methyltransferase RsmH [Polyangia bacterium]
MTRPSHTPVLLAQSIEMLAPRSGGIYCDATVGLGGHAEAILEASAPDGCLVGVDRDPDALALAGDRLRRFEDRVVLRHGRFSDLPVLLASLDLPGRPAAGGGILDGLLLDLGVSSLQLDDPRRGFSFRESGPLDMRMDPHRGRSASELLGSLSEEELARLLRRFGEQPRSRAVARAIKAYLDEEPEPDTAGLARIVAAVLPPRRQGGLHPATQTFMAIRIAVNEELEELESLLGSLLSLLIPGGRVAVISFHSLEDRLVKRKFEYLCRAGADLPPGLPVTEAERGPAPCFRLTRRAMEPTEAEASSNPRARSARLRAIGRSPQVVP